MGGIGGTGQQQNGTALPAGVIMQFGGASAPTGWLFCDGSAVSRSTYAGLFAAISTTFGVGNGTTTFNIPDFRGRVPVGVGSGQDLTPRTLGGGGGGETPATTVAVGAGDEDTIVAEGGSSIMPPFTVVNYIVKT